MYKRQDIKRWVGGKDVKRHIVKTDNDVKVRAEEIEKEYKLIIAIAGIIKSSADSIIIAYAQKNNAGVFTQERNKRAGETQNKIPDVCEALGVLCKRWPKEVWGDLGLKPI